jgi:hypothetical protein
MIVACANVTTSGDAKTMVTIVNESSEMVKNIAKKVVKWVREVQVSF